jgi:hypothetical protein
MFGIGPIELAKELDDAMNLQPRSLMFSLAAQETVLVRTELRRKQLMQEVGLQKTPLKLDGSWLGHMTSKPLDVSGRFLHNPRVLVWIQRDLYISKRFTADNFYLAREGERLPFLKLFRFSRDWWSW